MEINKEVALQSLMDKVHELVTICEGWDEKTENYKPGVAAQISLIHDTARQAIGLPPTDD